MTTENPILDDLPPGQPVSGADSRVQERHDQQVMRAQIATAKAPQMVNGTYGAVETTGPLSMDGEVLTAQPALDAQGSGDVGVSGRGVSESGMGTLKAAAERVMASVAAKVQGVLPPPGKTSSSQSFLQREDTGLKELGFIQWALGRKESSQLQRHRLLLGAGCFPLSRLGDCVRCPVKRLSYMRRRYSLLEPWIRAKFLRSLTRPALILVKLRPLRRSEADAGFHGGAE